jgi:hypothetical protein
MLTIGASWRAAVAANAACMMLTVGASPALAQGLGDSLKNLFIYGSPSAPPPSPQKPDEIECPKVTIADGGAALRAYGGRTGAPEALRHQISIVDVARECLVQADGTIVVRVGVEGRALIGPAGGAGRFDAPVRIVVKSGDRVLAARAQRAAVTVPAGQMQASFVVVEDRIVVPPGTDFEIEVGLGGPMPAERPSRGARR